MEHVAGAGCGGDEAARPRRANLLEVVRGRGDDERLQRLSRELAAGNYSSRRGRRALVREAVLMARPRFASASRNSHSIWPLTLRSSWTASDSIAAATAGSSRSRNALRAGGSL